VQPLTELQNKADCPLYMLQLWPVDEMVPVQVVDPQAPLIASEALKYRARSKAMLTRRRMPAMMFIIRPAMKVVLAFSPPELQHLPMTTDPPTISKTAPTAPGHPPAIAITMHAIDEKITWERFQQWADFACGEYQSSA
jgi:hypothetical protein